MILRIEQTEGGYELQEQYKSHNVFRSGYKWKVIGTYPTYEEAKARFDNSKFYQAYGKLI